MTGSATWGPSYWPWFLIIVAAAFLAPEIYALITNSANSLSDYAWGQLQVHDGQRFDQHDAAWLLTLGVWITAAVWLTWHIWFYRFR